MASRSFAHRCARFRGCGGDSRPKAVKAESLPGYVVEADGHKVYFDLLVGTVFFGHYEPRVRDNERRVSDAPLTGRAEPARVSPRRAG